jgi:hypothetical protein
MANVGGAAIDAMLTGCVAPCAVAPQTDLESFIQKEGTPGAALEKLQRLLKWAAHTH